MQQYLFFYTGIFSRRGGRVSPGRGQKFLDNLKKLYGKEILWKIDPSLLLAGITSSGLAVKRSGKMEEGYLTKFQFLW